jgi:hypothetical protein
VFEEGDEETKGNGVGADQQDQEESSMWQKCPVITFQTFDDLTGWFFLHSALGVMIILMMT